MARIRIERELMALDRSGMDGCRVARSENDDAAWVIFMDGPPGSLYEGGVFELSVRFPSVYPFKPPRVRFETRIFHPRIRPDGALDLDMLAEQWTPRRQVVDVLRAVRSLLQDPGDEMCFTHEAAVLYERDRAAFERVRVPAPRARPRRQRPAPSPVAERRARTPSFPSPACRPRAIGPACTRCLLLPRRPATAAPPRRPA